MLPCALSACADLDDETVADNPPPASVEQAPPQTPEPEIVPMLSNPQGELWRPGYWAMIDGNFVWIPGKIIPRPSPTAAWATARWVHHAYGWSFEMGHWE